MPVASRSANRWPRSGPARTPSTGKHLGHDLVMPVDTDVVNRWFDEYFATFEACARGERDMSELLGHYGVPLIFTSDAGVTTLMTDDEAAAMMQGLIDGLRANGYHHTDVLHPEVSVLNSDSALYRCALSRRKAEWRGIRLPHSHFSGYRRHRRVTGCVDSRSDEVVTAARVRWALRRRAQRVWSDPGRPPWIPVLRTSFRSTVAMGCGRSHPSVAGETYPVAN